MKDALRNRIALCLLILYVPLVSALGIMHTDDVPVLSPPQSGQIAYGQQGKTVDADHDSICFACLLTNGHFIEVSTPLPSLGVEYVIALPSIPFLHTATLYTRSARAPPSAS
jgi:hypothetical protein